jgi:hypothetical protein
MLAAFDPFSNLSMISLKDGIAFIDFFNTLCASNFDARTYDEKMIE